MIRSQNAIAFSEELNHTWLSRNYRRIEQAKDFKKKFLMTFIVSFKKVFYQFFSIHSPCVSRTFFGVFTKRILTHTYSHPCKHLYTISFSHSFILLELNLFLYLRTLMTMLLQSKKKSYTSFLISVTKAIIRKEQSSAVCCACLTW